MPKATAEDKAQQAEEVVLTYMRQQNRPFAATDVHLNLKGAVTKPAAQKALLALAEAGKLLKKEYGKSAIFVIKQDPSSALSAEELAALRESTATKKQALTDAKKQLAATQAQADAVAAALTNAQLVEQLALMKGEIEALTAELAQAKASGATPISDEQLATYERSEQLWRKMWISRRKAEKDLLAMFADAMGKEAVADLTERFSVSPDEDAEAEKLFTTVSI